MKHLLFVLLSSCFLLADQKPNVLFIAVDDLKPLINSYGYSQLKTPNFDRLAAMGTTFTNAHCQQAICGPSRASLLTGLRPDTTKVWDLKTRLRDILPDVVTLPQHFKNNGYKSIGIGKIFDPRNVDGFGVEDAASWSSPHRTGINAFPGNEMGYTTPQIVAKIRAKKKELKGQKYAAIKKAVGPLPAVEANDAPDHAYEDGVATSAAITHLTELAGQGTPFFYAIGFKKPHLPFIAPKKYWDLYKREDIKLAEFQTMPEGAPQLHFQDSWELKNGTYFPYKGVKGRLPDDQQRELIHGYMACVSYIDAQLGKLLDALAATKLDQNTIIVLWGDHGWHLGDHGMWCKHTNYEQATRVPLFIAQPKGKNGGQSSSSPVELIDIFPTLCDLAGLPKPDDLEGKSLLPILKDPTASIHEIAVSQYPRGGKKNLTMGYSYRDTRYRLIQWFPQSNTTKAPSHTELYDYETDPLETKNLATSPEHAQVLARLQKSAKLFHKK